MACSVLTPFLESVLFVLVVFADADVSEGEEGGGCRRQGDVANKIGQ